MTGIILTGHGEYASGVYSGLKLFCGEVEFFESVDFSPEESVESLTQRMKTAMENLRDCRDILIFADLFSGTPFNVAVRLQVESGIPVEVIGGGNTIAVMEACMGRDGKSALDLANEVIEIGRSQMKRYTPDASLETQGDDEL